MTNLLFLSKLLETIVLQQVILYLNCHDFLCPSQSAYRSGHSTERALLKVANDMLALDEGDVSILTLLDLSAAFDTTDHNILLQRLQTFMAFQVPSFHGLRHTFRLGLRLWP